MEKVSDELLEEAIKNSTSFRGALRYIGREPVGGNYTHYTRRVKNLGLDTSHFTGQAHNKGKPSLQRKTVDEIFIKMPSGSGRPKRNQLLRAMLEVGLEYKCSICLISSWNGKDITLDIDHIDGDFLNNLQSNLRFLCPNCHSQQEGTNKPHKYKSMQA